MTTDTLSTRFAALNGDLMGQRVKITVPYRGGQYAEIGTVVGIGFPVVEVDVGDQCRYRHVNRIELQD
jgi:hypothetical protein